MPILTVQLVLAAFILIPYGDTPILIRLALPGGTLLGMVIGYVSARLDGTREYRERVIAIGYVGFSVGGYYGSIGAFVVMVLGGVAVTGPVAGLGAGLIVAASTACITRWRYKPPVDPIAYERAMRRYVAVIGFVLGTVTWMIMVRGFYGLWAAEDLRVVAGWITFAVFAGLVSASFACCKSSCLTGWYWRASRCPPSPIAQPSGDNQSRATLSSGTI